MHYLFDYYHCVLKLNYQDEHRHTMYTKTKVHRQQVVGPVSGYKTTTAVVVYNKKVSNTTVV